MTVQELAPYELDVRPLLKSGVEPFQAIMGAVDSLAPGQGLLLIAPFKPVPLFAVLERKGFEAKPEPIGEGDWQVLFSPVVEPLAEVQLSKMSDRPISGRIHCNISTAPTWTRRSRSCAFWPKWKTCPQARCCLHFCIASRSFSSPNSKIAAINGSVISMRRARPIAS